MSREVSKCLMTVSVREEAGAPLAAVDPRMPAGLLDLLVCRCQGPACWRRCSSQDGTLKSSISGAVDRHLDTAPGASPPCGVKTVPAGPSSLGRPAPAQAGPVFDRPAAHGECREWGPLTGTCSTSEDMFSAGRSGRSPVGTLVTSGKHSVDPQRRASWRKRIHRQRQLLLIHVEIRTVGDDDCPFRGRRLHLRCGLWTTRWWWELELAD